jgi:hypothetical protein
MTDRYPNNRNWAVLNGVTYGATLHSVAQTVELAFHGETPPDERFTFNERFDVWTLTVPMAECEQLYTASSRAFYQGHLCQVIAIGADGNALLYYLEGNRGEAERLGFEQVDPGTHARTVPVNELHGYYEERRDLLFDGWREQAFPRETATSS